MVDVLRSLTVFLVGILTGAMLMEALIILPAMRAAGPAAALTMHKAIAPRARLQIPFTALGGAVTSTVALIIEHDLGDASTILMIVAWFSLLGGGLTTFLAYRPVDALMLHMSPEAVPPEYPEVFRRVRRIHTVRAIFFTVAFATFVAAAVAD